MHADDGMPDRRDRQIFQQGLEFFSAITRSLSHEMNNVLAIVNELSGLQDDCLIAVDDGRPLDQEKLKRTAQRIGLQVERGKAFVKQLNGFAHCIDHAGVQLDIGDNLESVVALCQRFARLGKVELELQPIDERRSVEGCPFDLQHVIYRCLEIVLDVAPEGSHITATLVPEGTITAVTIRVNESQLPEGGVDAKLGFLALLTDALGGTLDVEKEAGRPWILVLRLPPVIRRLCQEEVEGAEG